MASKIIRRKYGNVNMKAEKSRVEKPKVQCVRCCCWYENNVEHVCPDILAEQSRLAVLKQMEDL